MKERITHKEYKYLKTLSKYFYNIYNLTSDLKREKEKKIRERNEERERE